MLKNVLAGEDKLAVYMKCSVGRLVFLLKASEADAARSTSVVVHVRETQAGHAELTG